MIFFPLITLICNFVFKVRGQYKFPCVSHFPRRAVSPDETRQQLQLIRYNNVHFCPGPILVCCVENMYMLLFFHMTIE